MPAPPFARPFLDRLGRSMSAKLFALTVLFVLIAEAVVLVPSVAKERITWLNARIEAAYLVSVALEAPEAQMIDPDTAFQLFATADIASVAFERDGASHLVYAPDLETRDVEVKHFIDLRDHNALAMIGAAWASLFSTGDSFVEVRGAPMTARDETVKILVAQRAMRENLAVYARNIFLISLLISTMTAFFIYRTLNRHFVEPVRLLTKNMKDFQERPEEPGNIIKFSGRRDEIGDAQKGLAALEMRLKELLAERRRLAALGAGISKISHDLRNILASAQLMSDRLARSEDPRVRKLSPRLISSLDRAIALSQETVLYGKMAPETLSKAPVDIRALVEEVFEDRAERHVEFVNAVEAGATAAVDRTHLYRAIFNLVGNAVDALSPPPPEKPGDGRERRIEARSSRARGALVVDIADNGPGLPEDAKSHLFEPFRGSRKPGGSGLGVAISQEILRAHGGDLSLVKSDATGATFRLTIPLGNADAAAGGRARERGAYSSVAGSSSNVATPDLGPRGSAAP